MNDRWNLSAWALLHPQMIIFMMVVLMVAGTISYFKLGRAEAPDFTFKVMVVRTLWPGASAKEVEAELTERIEKKLYELAWVDVLRSASRPGESLIFVILKDYTPKGEVPESWRQVRKKLDDIQLTLPQGVIGPFPNEEFGDVMVNVFALTGDGYDLAELRRQADAMAKELRRVPDVKRVELIGVQDEKIFVEISPERLAVLGITPRDVAESLQKENAVHDGGFVETVTDRLHLRVTGPFASVEKVREADLIVGGRHFRLADIAKVSHGYADPPSPRMRFNGQPAIGIGVVMTKGGDVIGLGTHLRNMVSQLAADLPTGLEVHSVADQPKKVQDSLELFVVSLGEAIAIVLAVSFISLGWRTGTVVALSIPLVLAITFALMKVFAIDLHRISLGALVISLGLLVDDAIIAAEMMVVKMEQGWDRFRAATFSYTSTAFPMLTGTLITAAGFTPVGFAQSSSGEYCFSMFAVVTIALLSSWVVAVVFTPYLGYRLLDPDKLLAKAQGHGEDIYNTGFYRRFARILEWCLDFRWVVIGATILAFALAIVAFKFGVPKQFFPASDRSDLLVNVWLPQNASLKATEVEVHKIEDILRKDPAVESFSSYVGNGAPRFYLPLDQQLFANNFAEMVVATRNAEDREAVKNRLRARFAATDGEFAHLRLRVLRLENGPPVGYPMLFRVMGPDIAIVRDLAYKVSAVMRANPHLIDVSLDWNEQVKAVRVEIDQDRARQIGVTTQDVAQALRGWQQGILMTQYREGDQLIDVVMRAPDADRNSLDRLPDLDIITATGRHVSVAQVAHLKPVLEEGVIWRRDRLPTISVRADVPDEIQPQDASLEVESALTALRASLPVGYRIETGGAIEESNRGERSIMGVMPLMFVGIVTLLMIQLQNVSRSILVILSAPLGLIGVAMALLIFRVPFGFVANLGVIALAGMIMRNSVILVDQIEQDEKSGRSPWDSIIGATVRRFRPIVLTAAAAMLAMLPLIKQAFWGPMAVAIMGGLIVATALTCLFLPALYAAWFRVARPN